MILPGALCRYWQAIWPVDFQASVSVNASSGVCLRRDRDNDVFAGTRWSDVVIQTRGNGLFVYQPDECGSLEAAAPSMAWVIEHCAIELRPSGAHMTLPASAGAYGAANGAILYFTETKGDDQPFLSIYFPQKEAGHVALERLRRCSLSYLRRLQGDSADEDVRAGDVAHTIESLRYSQEHLSKQKDIMRLDNTLLMAQYAANKQVFSECTEMQMHENFALKTQLDRCHEHIRRLEANSTALEQTLESLREEKSHLLECTAKLESQLTTARTVLAETREATENDLLTQYQMKVADVVRLNGEIEELRMDKARLANRFQSFKREVDREYERVEDFLYHGAMYELLMHWILCNDLKVEYYETSHQMTPKEHHAFAERWVLPTPIAPQMICSIQHAQNELRTLITVARASYISCRTHVFNELLSSIGAHKLELPRSKRMLALALGKLDWIFQPESSKFNVHEPLWMNQENFDGLVEKLIYSNSDTSWYNRLSYVAALRPILTNDAASDSMLLTLKRQLYDCLGQNDALKQQVAALQKLTGTESHWKKMWHRALE